MIDLFLGLVAIIGIVGILCLCVLGIAKLVTVVNSWLEDKNEY